MTEPSTQLEAPLGPMVDWNQPVESSQRGSARTRSRWAIATLAIAGVLGAIAAVQDLMGIGVIESAFAGTLTDADAQAFDSMFSAMGLVQVAILIATAVAFLAWLSRSVDTVPRLTGEPASFTPRWSIGWWFVPFANFVMPYRVVADLYRRMSPVAQVGTAIVGVWWVIWLIGNIVSNVAGRLWLAGDDLAELTFALQAYAISDISDPIAAALIIVIIVRIQRWADAREPGPVVVPPSDDDPTLVGESGA